MTDTVSDSSSVCHTADRDLTEASNDSSTLTGGHGGQAKADDKPARYAHCGSKVSNKGPPLGINMGLTHEVLEQNAEMDQGGTCIDRVFLIWQHRKGNKLTVVSGYVAFSEVQPRRWDIEESACVHMWSSIGMYM